MKKAAIYIAILAVAAVVVQAFLFRNEANAHASPVMIYCAAGMKKPIEKICEQFLQETSAEVSLQFAGTGTLLSQLRLSRKGDVLIAADSASMADAVRMGLVGEHKALVQQQPVIAVAKGNPKKIQGLQDLMRPDVRLALPNAEAASIGRVCKNVLGAEWDRLAGKAVVTKLTVMELGSDIQLGAADAALVWDHVVRQFDGLEAVTAAELAKGQDHAEIGVLKFSTQPEAARLFMNYLTNPERGGVVFAHQGYHLPAAQRP